MTTTLHFGGTEPLQPITGALWDTQCLKEGQQVTDGHFSDGHAHVTAVHTNTIAAASDGSIS